MSKYFDKDRIQANSPKGFFVMTYGGGRYQSIAWFAEYSQAEKLVASLKAKGAWQGMPPKIEPSK